MVDSVKFIKTKGPRETQEPGFDEKFLLGERNLTKLENLHQLLRGDVMLGKCCMPSLCLVYHHYLRKEIVGGGGGRGMTKEIVRAALFS